MAIVVIHCPKHEMARLERKVLQQLSALRPGIAHRMADLDAASNIDRLWMNEPPLIGVELAAMFSEEDALFLSTLLEEGYVVWTDDDPFIQFHNGKEYKP